MHIKQKDDFISSWKPFLVAAALAGACPAFAAESTPKNDAGSAAQQTVAAVQPDAKDDIEEGTAGSFLSGQFARQSGDVDAAISYLSRALTKNPGNPDLASQLLSMQVAKGDMAAALATAQSLQANKWRDPLAELLVSISLVKEKDFKTAGKKLNEAFDTASGQLWLPLVDAWIDAGKGQVKKPVTIEEMPVTVGRAASMINYHLALINEFAGFSDAASGNFSEAIDDAESAASRMMQQVEYFHKKHPQYAELASLIERYKTAHPEPLPPIESTVGSASDGIAEVLYTMGSVMQMAGVKHDAAVYLQLARYLRPDFHLASFALAEVFIDSDAFERASTVLSSIPPTSQYAMKAALRQSLMLDRMNKTTEALATLADLAARNPKSPDPMIAKGDLLRVHQRFLEASIAYSDAIKRTGEPGANDWPVFYARGACYERLDRWNEAKADLRKSLELNPDQPDVLNYLGYGLLVRGENVTEARAMLEKAIAANPNDPQIVDSMGWALFISGEYEQSLPYLERAVELLPTDATVNDHLGDAYWRLGRKTEARFQWQRALTFKPDEEEVQKITAKIASGLPDAPSATTKSAAAEAAPDNIH